MIIFLLVNIYSIITIVLSIFKKLKKDLYIHKKHEDCVTSILFNHNDRLILSGSSDTTAIIWDYKYHTVYAPFIILFKRFRMHREIINIIWEYSNNSYKYLIGHENYFASVKFSPDSKYIITVSDDNTMILWNTYTCSIIRTFEDHTDMISSIDYSNDNKYLASGSHDKTIIIYDALGYNIIKRI